MPSELGTYLKSTNDLICNFCLVCWDDRNLDNTGKFRFGDGCDKAHEYCDMDKDRCVPFTGEICYTHVKSLNLVINILMTEKLNSE